ncbi:MAG: hypothetical protein GXY08_05265 [Ruminococcus sp.]|nr:hypothetical protein [Ruminococcus sp.]
MKKTMFIAISATILLTGCGSAAPSSDATVSEYHASMTVEQASDNALSAQNDNNSEEIDIDLTQLDSNMVYAQVFDMVNNSDNYLGKTVKAKGPFSYFQETDGREFYAVLISDATACCSQGIEFVLDGNFSYPDDYPSIGTNITVVGKFNYYEEEGYTYCQLIEADMEVDTALS